METSTPDTPKSNLLNIVIIIIALTVIGLISVISYLAYQYANDAELVKSRQIEQEQEAKTYEDKVRSGDIILSDK